MSSAANVMLAIHEKRTTPTDLYRPLRLYIASAYSEREAAAADDDLAAVRDLRADVEQPSLPDPSSLERRRDALLAYARALSLVEPRFPISSDRAHVHSLAFTWHDAFKTGKKASVASIHLEKAAVLFNLAAVYSQIALAADRATDVGIRTACGSFQSAAGAFAWMRESGVAAKAVAAGATTVDVLSLLSPASPPNHLALLPALRDPAPGLALPRCRHGAPTPASAAAPAPASTAVVAAEPPPPRPAPPPPAAGRAHLRPRRSCPALPPPVASRA